MDITAALDAPTAPTVLLPHVEALDRYPAWMPLAHRVVADGVDTEGRPAWQVELRARLGPFARSKRLRMVRTVHDVEHCLVRFERAELDGRAHSPWVLDATIETIETDQPGDACRLTMRLHYGGALWTGGVMERVLADQIVAGRERLLVLVSEG